MGAYDILTGTQLCMAVAMIAYGFYFKKKRTCRVWYFSGPAWLIAIWSAVVLYYLPMPSDVNFVKKLSKPS